MEWLNEYHLGGIAIGICTFLIIGLFHPVVVKAEYYWVHGAGGYFWYWHSRHYRDCAYQ